MAKKLLTDKRKKWLEQRKNPPVISGKPLHYPELVGEKYAKAIMPIVNAMLKETQVEIEKLYRSSSPVTDGIMDASLSNQASFLLNRLKNKFLRIFKKRGLEIIEQMINGVDKSSAVSLGISLKELSGGLTISTDFLTGEMNEQFKAITKQNVSLFKTIAEKHFATVENKVMESIISGKGLEDLIPFFQGHSNGTRNYAHLRALDQTRKAFTGISTSRMKSVGIKKFRWIHSGGSEHPRKLHKEMDRKIFSFDDPPVIYTEKGKDVRGLPGMAVFCRCIAQPVLDFGVESNA